MPFVPTPAAFFSAAGGVVIRRTFSAGAERRGLESAAQFSTGCIVIPGTICPKGIVIGRTFCKNRRLLSAAQFPAEAATEFFVWLLFTAQFAIFPACCGVVVQRTF